jgi:death-on-curing protein
VDYPTLEDYLLTAEAVLGIDASGLLRLTKISLAESALSAPQADHFGVEHYPDPATKAAVLCSRIVKNHALPDGNKRVGLLLMLDCLARNDLTWKQPAGGQDEIADVIERLAGRAPRMTEAEFVEWVGRHVS